MALYFYTNEATKLLESFKKKIDDGHVTTWEYDNDGDFTHTTHSGEWRNVAWLTPKVLSDRLKFNILGRSDRTMTKPVYGIYHGRFTESLLTHCDSLFSGAYASSLPAVGDIINPGKS